MSSRIIVGVSALLEKMRSSDADFRYMALNDLMTELRKDASAAPLDANLETQVVSRVLETMRDTNGEVKNMAVRCLGILVARIRPAQMQTIVDRLTEFISSKEEEQRDIASLGLKTVLSELPLESDISTMAGAKLAPKLLAQIGEASSSQELLIDSLELLAELFSRFPAIPASDKALQRASLETLLAALPHDRAAVRKRAVSALGALAASSTSEVFTALASAIITALDGAAGSAGNKEQERARTMVQLVATLARTCPARIGRRLPELMPRILAAVQSEDDELREATLQAMEAIVLRCPSDVTPFVIQIVDEAVKLLRHDPNYAGGDDSDDEMADEDDEEEDEMLDEADYSDDDDLSWKVRRAAAKVIAAAVTTRHEQLLAFVVSVAPELVARFSEREESVRIEVLQTFLALLRQLQLHAGTPQLTDVIGASPGALKRKRDAMETNEGEASPRARLAQLVPSISKALSREMLSKSLPTRFASYTVLRELVLVLQGGLDAHIGLLVGQTDKALRGVDAGASASGANLRGEVLLFLRVLFQFHAPQAFEAYLDQLVAVIVAAIDDKLHRDAVEAFAVCSQLVAVLRPLSGSHSSGSAYKPHLEHIYRAVLARLRRPDSDQEIKDRGIATLGVLLAHGGDALEAHLDECLPELLERLRNEVTRFATVKVVGAVAASRVCQGAAFDAFVRDCVAEVSTLLRKSSRPLKLAAFETLDALLRRAGGGLDEALCAQIFAEIEPLMGAEGDVNLLPMALHAASLLLELHPATAAPTTQSRIVPHLLLLLHSPLMQGAALDAVTTLFKTLARVQPAAAPSCIEALMGTLKAASGKGSGTAASAQTHATVARCIGAVLVSTPQQSEAVVTGALKTLERGEAKASEVHLYFNLLLLGEIGRFDDLAARPGLLERVVAFYGAESEEIKSAAAFALGNMAVGSLAIVLPLLEQHIASDDAKRRLLSLHALKELLSHASPSALASIAQRLWTPLFEHCETAEEATRNIGAECLARLTLNDPAAYLPQLKARLHSPSAATRAAVISAVRFTLTESRASYDELLAPEMLDFLSLLQDAALEVRRHAAFALNAAAHNKPHLISDQLVILLPLLYQETHPRPELLRKVTMGPFTVTSDDGLDLRKTAYETMLTLLDTSLGKIDLNTYMDRVVAGLSDEDGIKVLCYLILVRLADVAPLQVAPHLDAIAPPILSTLKLKPKDAASKQDIERAAELQRSIFRALAQLDGAVPHARAAPKFAALLAEAKAVPGGAYAAASAAAATAAGRRS